MNWASMRRSRKGVGAQIIVMIIALAILAGGFGYYFVSVNATLSSLDAKVSSLQSASASQDQVVAAQQSEISCLNDQITSLQQESSSATGSSGSNGTSSTSSSSSTACTTIVGASHVIVGGNLTVPSGQGTGTLMVSVYDGASEPISNVTVDVSSASLSAPSGPIILLYNGTPVNATNTIPMGGTADGHGTVESGGSGLYVSYGYSFTVYITFSNGATTHTQLYVKALI